jgi:hypothetical protein
VLFESGLELHRKQGCYETRHGKISFFNKNQKQNKLKRRFQKKEKNPSDIKDNLFNYKITHTKTIKESNNKP